MKIERFNIAAWWCGTKWAAC